MQTGKSCNLWEKPLYYVCYGWYPPKAAWADCRCKRRQQGIYRPIPTLYKDKAAPTGRTGEQQKKFHRCRGTKTNGKEWITMNLPKDPAILLSFVNTHLRDRYPSLEEFCKSTGVPMEEVTDALAAIDYYYQPDRNQFV